MARVDKPLPPFPRGNTFPWFPQLSVCRHSQVRSGRERERERGRSDNNGEAAAVAAGELF